MAPVYPAAAGRQLRADRGQGGVAAPGRYAVGVGHQPRQRSLCGVRVIEGVATETVFETTLSGQLAARETRELAAGSLVINGHLDIHQVANLQADGGDLVTLHLYSPPLSRMELFGMEPQQRRVQVLDDCLEFQI
ncbi:hypothetical protein C3E98_039550 [Pseudomonas sp. MWU13-2625]|nr:hypothetical protein C3E98_039550 [Pseudomonas sp. MWU13-2625]